MSARPTELVLLGRPVDRSMSPRIQRAALEAAGIDATYVAVDVSEQDFATKLAELCARNAAGNVTIPHKRAAFALCDTLTEVAREVGAVNTFWSIGGRVAGDNTDVAGFDAAARALLAAAERPPPARVSMVGAGGAAAAVAAAVSRWDACELHVWSRSPARAADLAQRFDCARAARSMAEALAHADLVVNATPVGMRDDALPVPIHELPKGCVVIDVVYRVGKTRWVNDAGAAGHPSADGLRMLVEQGAAAFTRWFGVAADRAAMWRAATAGPA